MSTKRVKLSSDLLIKQPSLLDSITSIFSIFPRKIQYNWDITDAELLRSDWEAVGKDMRQAIDKLKIEYKELEHVEE